MTESRPVQSCTNNETIYCAGWVPYGAAWAHSFYIKLRINIAIDLITECDAVLFHMNVLLIAGYRTRDFTIQPFYFVIWKDRLIGEADSYRQGQRLSWYNVPVLSAELWCWSMLSICL